MGKAVLSFTVFKTFVTTCPYTTVWGEFFLLLLCPENK